MIIKRFEARDLDQAFELRNDPKLMRWFRQIEPLQWKNHTLWFDCIDRSDSTRMFSLRSEASDFLIGVAGLTGMDRINSRAELSLYVNPTEQRKGLGTSAMKFLLEQAFEVHNFNLVFAETVGENLPAFSLFKKFGFIKDGERREYYYREGEYQTAHLFSMTKKEYFGLFS